MTKPKIHPHLLTLDEYQRLRALREEALAEGMSEEDWNKTFSGARLGLLEAWWTVMQTLVDGLSETMRGRKALWLMRQRPVRWLLRRFG